MPYPDNFSGRAFDRQYGTEFSNRRVDIDMNAARRLKAAAQTFIQAVEGLEFSGPVPTNGYDIAEIVDVVRDAAAIDLGAFEARLICDEMEDV